MSGFLMPRVRHFAVVAALGPCLAFGIDVASAQPVVSDGAVALRWNDCYGDGGMASKSFACNTNSGASVLVVSAIPYQTLPAFNGGVVTITVKTPGAPLASWWDFSSGSCRGTSALTALMSPPPSLSQCYEFNSQYPNAPFSLSYSYGVEPYQGPNPNAATIQVVFGLPEPIEIPAGLEMFLCRIQTNHTKSTGDGACIGCEQGLCVGVNRVFISQPAAFGPRYLLSPIEGTSSDVASWQGSFSMSADPPYLSNGSPARRFRDCLDVTDAKRPTWGAIKRMYR